MNNFSLKKLSQTEMREQNHIQNSNRFANLEKSNDSENINRAWEGIEENVKISAKECLGQYEREKHKSSLMKNGQNF